MKGALKTLVATATLMLPFVSHAGYINADWKEKGDDRLFVSLDTKQVFLKLTETTFESMDSIQQRLLTDLMGWRIATQSDMDILFEEFTGVKPSGTRLSELQSNYHNLQRLLGVTDTSSDHEPSSRGLFVGDDGVTYEFAVSEWRGDDYINYMYNRCSTCRYTGLGIWLTPDENNLTLFQQNNTEYNTISDVSAPAALSLLVLGVWGAFRRRA